MCTLSLHTKKKINESGNIKQTFFIWGYDHPENNPYTQYTVILNKHIS